MCGPDSRKRPALVVEAMIDEENLVCPHCGASDCVADVCCSCGRSFGGADNYRTPNRGDLIRGELFARGPHDPLVSRISQARRIASDFMAQEDVLLIVFISGALEIAVFALILVFFC